MHDLPPCSETTSSIPGGDYGKDSVKNKKQSMAEVVQVADDSSGACCFGPALQVFREMVCSIKVLLSLNTRSTITCHQNTLWTLIL